MNNLLTDSGNGKADLSIEVVKKNTLVSYLETFTGTANALNNKEKAQFLEIAAAFNLNPFKREIHAVAYGEGEYRKVSIITGYEVYLKRAERTGLLDGWRVWTEGEGENMKACIEIYRKDRKYPFKHEVYFSESKATKKDGTLTQFWKKQPKFQLKKVAISQGFRLCFPDELGGMPYTSDELNEQEYEGWKKTENSAPEKQDQPKIQDAELVEKPEEAVKKEFCGKEITDGGYSFLTEGDDIPSSYWKLTAVDKQRRDFARRNCLAGQGLFHVFPIHIGKKGEAVR